MPIKSLYLLILFLFLNANADHIENQDNCERLGGVYTLDKKTSSWGCYRLAYTIADHAEIIDSRKKCEHDNKLYGWNGSQYDCFFPKKINLLIGSPQNISETYSNATLNRRALCEDNGNIFIWNKQKNNWECQKLIYRTFDRNENSYNRNLCETQGHQYEWDGKFYSCIDKTEANKNTALFPPNETLQHREICEKNGDLFRWNDTNNSWECMSLHIPKGPNETLQRREVCEKSGKFFEWDGVKNEWHCEDVSISIINTFPKTKSINKIAINTTPVYNEMQEKRASCEQKGYIFTWNGNVNEWQCFQKIDTITDFDFNVTHKTTCEDKGYMYFETDKRWECLKYSGVAKSKKLDLNKLTSVCNKYNGKLELLNGHWTCLTKSTTKEIEESHIPSQKIQTK